MRKFMFSLLAIALVVGASAFTLNKTSQAKKPVDAAIYYQTTEGFYVRTNPETNCQIPSDNPCEVYFLHDPGVPSFYISSPPAPYTGSGVCGRRE